VLGAAVFHVQTSVDAASGPRGATPLGLAGLKSGADLPDFVREPLGELCRRCFRICRAFGHRIRGFSCAQEAGSILPMVDEDLPKMMRNYSLGDFVETSFRCYDAQPELTSGYRLS
jgi:hypothetical protein